MQNDIRFPVIELTPFTRWDIPRLIQWNPSEAFTLQWAGRIFSYPLDRRQLIYHLKRSRGKDPSIRIYKAVDTQTGAIVGHGEIAGIDHWNRCGTLCRILVGPESLRGCGVGIQIVESLLVIAFDELGLHRVGLQVFDFNEPAMGFYQKAGFVKEGLMREVRKYRDTYWSSCVMSILEHEWRRRGQF
jgi:RimJ/RimL family protein N-acetyltransferase